jgi:diguanylate cyclase (GGDEF)-like protein
MLNSLIGGLRLALRKPTRSGVGYSLKTRLYTIIGLLGLLPVLGVGFALVTMVHSTRDNAALDRAARGTIYLERINGLVYAVVMESRGIYMSADWKAAEPFAQNLLRRLPELQEVARTWKAEAITSQQSNVEELARRIDQFVQFRTELVRLGKEDGTAAARAFGDNDANRNLRTALNESLSIVARAYEQEIVGARSKIEADNRDFMAALGVLAGIAFIALCGGVMLVRSGLLPPLLSVKGAMLRLAQGDLASDGKDRPRAIELAEMEQAIGVLRTRLIERDKLNREAQLLSELDEWLQSCNSLPEIYGMVAEFISQLLPGCAGTLYVYTNSRDVLESTKAWNGGRMMPAMHPEDCWGLRRGRTYSFGESEIDFPCGHVHVAGPIEYCCIPILAHSETIGLLHLEFCGDAQENLGESHKAAIAEQRRLGIVCAEHFSLAIANVKLRDRLRDQSIRDVLTGLFNRRYMLETCAREFSRAARARQGVGVVSIDIDNFKKYNDEHGHDAGDAVLRVVGGCLETTFRNADVACRFGGEEFLVILPGATLEIAARRAEAFRRRIESLVVRYAEENLPTITVSIGVAAFPDAGGNPQLVLKAADEALYLAKKGGRNRVELAPSARRGPATELPASELAVSDRDTDQPSGRLAAAADG